PSDGRPRTELLSMPDSPRAGTLMARQDWLRRTEVITQPAPSTATIAPTTRRCPALPARCHSELAARNFPANAPPGDNAWTVFEFDEHGKIRQLDVYLQQER